MQRKAKNNRAQKEKDRNKKERKINIIVILKPLTAII
jgi:hypothetical protein